MKAREKQTTGAAQARTKRTRAGGYSMILIVIAVVLAIIVNLVVGSIPSTLTKYDLSEKKLYTISDQTKEIAGNLETDVTLYLIAQTGEEDDVIQELLKRYDGLSNKISVKQVDPIVFPYFTEQYTDDVVEANSVIVESGNRSRVIPYDDIYVYTYDYNIYSQQGDGSNYYTVEFDGEGQITSAINYVTSKDLPMVYFLSGHGEQVPDDELQDALATANMPIEYLNIMSKDELPADTGCIFIYGPTSDLNNDELELLMDYMSEGGNILYVSQAVDANMTNFNSLMEYYGMEAIDGIVVEGNANYCQRGYYHYLMPEMVPHIVTAPLIEGNYRALMPLAQGLKALDSYRGTLTVQSLMDTSDSAFSKLAGYGMTTMEKEEGDIEGPFSVGMASMETLDKDTVSKVVWYPTTQFLLADNDEISSGANYSLYLSTLSWMCSEDNSLAIVSKNLGSKFLTFSAMESNIWSIVMAVVVPVAVVVWGLLVWLRRRKK